MPQAARILESFFGNPRQRLLLIAGPCVLESDEINRRIGLTLRDACAEAGVDFCFKASFDKANRSSGKSVRGPGIDAGLERLAALRAELACPVTSDVHEPGQCELAAKVLDRRPHLVVSEFVNDAGLSPEQVEERYGRLLADFRGIDAEWIILTPHYVMPSWMKLDSQRQIDDDPRPYVAGVREFGRRHGVPVADASLRYGRLWRQGIPYQTLMENDINHPNVFGHGLFADSLLALFP